MSLARLAAALRRPPRVELGSVPADIAGRVERAMSGRVKVIAVSTDHRTAWRIYGNRANQAQAVRLLRAEVGHYRGEIGRRLRDSVASEL